MFHKIHVDSWFVLKTQMKMCHPALKSETYRNVNQSQRKMNAKVASDLKGWILQFKHGCLSLIITSKGTFLLDRIGNY